VNGVICAGIVLDAFNETIVQMKIEASHEKQREKALKALRKKSSKLKRKSASEIVAARELRTRQKLRQRRQRFQSLKAVKHTGIITTVIPHDNK